MKQLSLCFAITFFLMDWLPAAQAQAQAQTPTRTVSGRVLDGGNQQGLPGVTVRVPGTTLGTATDNAGAFALSGVPATATRLEFSFVGFRSAEQALTDAGAPLAVTLVPETRALDEVVVTGLATSIKRSNLANSVATVSGQELVGQTRPVTLDAALQGKVAGALISQTSGAPGGGISVQLRGPSSIIGNSEPLYIIDGVYANNEVYDSGRSSNAFNQAGTIGQQSGTTNRISDLNPDDIENVEVLKGSSAAAIYGARANAGVIIITTKKGRAGQTRVGVRQDIGVTTILRKLGYEGWTADKIARVAGTVGLRGSGDVATEQALLATAQAAGRIYDYENELFGNTGVLSNTNVSVSGGSERLRFFASAGRADEGAIQKGLGFVRNTARLNLNADLAQNVDVSFNVSYINAENKRGFNGNNNNNISVPWLLSFTPSYAELHPDAQGRYPDNPYISENPLALRDRAVNTETTNRFLQSLALNWYVFRRDNSSLRLSGQGGVDFTLTDQELYLPEDLQSQRSLPLPGASRYTKNQQLNYNVQGAAVYTHQAGRATLTTQAGIARISNSLDLSYTQGQGLQPGLRNPQAATLQTLGQYFSSGIDVGYFVQQEVNFADRVVATAGLRADQSNRYGDPNRPLYSPKASLAVNLANFDFWTYKDAVNLLKPRVAYGQTGGTIPYGAYYNATLPTAIGGALGVRSSQLLGYANVRPERATELEAGLDAAFLNSKITLEVSVYHKVVRDFLFPYSLAASTGVTQIQAYPVGDLRNQGLEISLGFKAVDKPNFKYTEQTQFWLNRSAVTRLAVPVQPAGPGYDPYFGRNYLIEGQSPTRWFGTPLDAATGLPTPYQESQPRYQVSFANTFTFFKNLELFFLIHVKQGGYNEVLTRQAYDLAGTTKDWSAPATAPDGTATTVGALRAYPATPNQGFIEDASYMKLREVSLYYTVPKAALGNPGRGVERLRVGVSGNNLVLVSPYRAGYDPEVSNFGIQPVGGYQDLWNFPSARRMFFHVNIDF